MYAFGVEFDLPFDTVVDKTIAAPAAQKLGVVSDVNVVIRSRRGLHGSGRSPGPGPVPGGGCRSRGGPCHPGPGLRGAGRLSSGRCPMGAGPGPVAATPRPSGFTQTP